MTTDTLTYIWPTNIQEYLYCPRFVYFFHVLAIPQFEENRFKVQKGREIHNLKRLQNREYIRKRLAVTKKMIAVPLSSQSLRLKGEVDEILFFDDDTAAPLDYKFAEWKGKLYRTLRYQSMIYAVMIEDIFNVTVRKGYIVYTRSRNRIEEIKHPDNKKTLVTEMVDAVFNIIENEIYPEATTSKRQCYDCCYRKICTQ